MSEFATLIKEALIGDEPFAAMPGREAVEASIRQFERRMRTIRRMTWTGVSLMFAVVVFAIVGFVRLDESASVRSIMIYLGLFIWGNVGVAMAKLWFATAHDNIALMKELKRVQILIIDVMGKEYGFSKRTQ